MSKCEKKSRVCSFASSIRSTGARSSSNRAAFEQLHVEEVAGERRQPPRLGVDDLEVTALLVGRKVALEQQRREAEHRRQRRPELVRDHADQIALVLLALAQLLVLREHLAAAESSDRAIELNPLTSAATSPAPRSSSRTPKSPRGDLRRGLGRLADRRATPRATQAPKRSTSAAESARAPAPTMIAPRVTWCTWALRVAERRPSRVVISPEDRPDLCRAAQVLTARRLAPARPPG